MPHKPLAIVAAVLLAGLTFPPGAGGQADAGQPVAFPEPLPLHQDLLSGLTSCSPTQALTLECPREQALSHIRDLADQSNTMPEGPEGPGAWIALATQQAGIEHTELPTGSSTGLEETLNALSTSTGHGLTHAQVVSLRDTLEELTGDQRDLLRRLLATLATADRLSHEARDGVSGADLSQAADRLRQMTPLVQRVPFQGLPPQIQEGWSDDLATLDRVDMAKMTPAALLLSQAIELATANSDRLPEIDLPWITIGGDGDDVYTDNKLLLIDKGGNDTYHNNAGGPILAGAPSPGLAIDLGQGNDTYQEIHTAQGYGLGSVGILYDEGGDDTYSVVQNGQGAGTAGIGLLYDAGDGDDTYLSPNSTPYRSITAIASGFGGIGLLVDEGGHDRLRMDGRDGFIYGAVGGLGLMANRGNGNDTYTSRVLESETADGHVENRSGPIQVSAEASGGAVLIEEGGDDVYTCGVRVGQGCQGAGGDGSIGLLIDLAGEDTYWMGNSTVFDIVESWGPWLRGNGIPFPEGTNLSATVAPMGQGAGYGLLTIPQPMVGIGILYDADGSDSYTAEKWAQGYGGVGGIGMLFDAGADPDVYNNSLSPLVGERTDGSWWEGGTGGIGFDDGPG